MLMGLPDRWDTCSRSIYFEEVPRGFARCGDTIAVGVGYNVVLLDAITGIRKSVLSGHTDSVLSLVSSLDGTMLLSRSQDHVLNLWDVQTGGVIRTFGPYASVHSASISPDGTTIALGAPDGVIRLWDVRTWKCRSIEMFRGSGTKTIEFSPIDPRRLLSSSQSGIVYQWDADGHQIGAFYCDAGRLDGHSYTLDGTRFVSWGLNHVTVRDSESGAVTTKFSVPSRSRVSQCCFSPDGRLVACAATNTIYIWDITTPGPRLVGHIGHYSFITFIAFSPFLISGSRDQAVKFWQSSNFLAESMTTGHNPAASGPTTIKSVKVFAEDSIIVTSDSSGTVKTWDLTTGGPKSSFRTPATGRRDTHLEGDTLVIAWLRGKELHIWDVYKRRLLRKFNTPLDLPLDLKISGDGSKIFGLIGGHIKAVSMQTGEGMGSAKLGHEATISFFVDGCRVGINNRRDRGWDFGGPKVSDFREFPDRPRLDLVDWPIAGLARPCWIEDTETKRRIFRLPEKYTRSATQVEWDGRCLLVLPHSTEGVVVMDFDPVCPR